MFLKISRYQTLTDVMLADAKGRVLRSKSIRLLPEVSGTFLHTIESGTRLDHLAYRYYKQPRKWWRICDANPEQLSPLALVGTEPIVTYRFPVEVTDRHSPPPWALLIKHVSAVVGVEDVAVNDAVQIVHAAQASPGGPAAEAVEQHEYTVIVTYNRLNVSAASLQTVMTAAGFEVSAGEQIGRIGKTLVIPPDGNR